MSFKIQVLPRLDKAFGFIASNYISDLLEGEKPASRFSGEYFVNPSYSFADMILQGNKNTINFGGNNLSAKNASSQTFISPPMISVTRSKDINVTSPDRGEGEVVENFSKRSYEISMKGIIVDMLNHQYPKNGVQSVRGIFDFNGVYDVTCMLLNDLGIYSLYFTDLDDLSGVEGYADTLSYSFKARSYQPAILTAY